MKVIQTPLEDCYIIKAKKFGDNRGYFMESFNQEVFRQQGIEFEVKQINVAKSQRNVLRGLHYQAGDFAQAKLVHVINGAVIDVAVDLRTESPTFMKHFKCELRAENDFFLVPRGFAHGYLTIEDNTVFQYAVDNYYSPMHEAGVMYDDPKLNIDWGFDESPMISKKDLEHPLL